MSTRGSWDNAYDCGRKEAMQGTKDEMQPTQELLVFGELRELEAMAKGVKELAYAVHAKTLPVCIVSPTAKAEKLNEAEEKTTNCLVADNLLSIKLQLGTAVACLQNILDSIQI